VGLSRYKVAAAIAVSNMNRAREFYEGKLGLSVGIDSASSLASREVYLCYTSAKKRAGKASLEVL
jgi:catechol 2,3-dioxygenase-like lactoylglutathione lyase family enzyme